MDVLADLGLELVDGGRVEHLGIRAAVVAAVRGVRRLELVLRGVAHALEALTQLDQLAASRCIDLAVQCARDGAQRAVGDRDGGAVFSGLALRPRRGGTRRARLVVGGSREVDRIGRARGLGLGHDRRVDQGSHKLRHGFGLLSLDSRGDRREARDGAHHDHQTVTRHPIPSARGPGLAQRGIPRKLEGPMQDAILKCVPIGANPYPGHGAGLKATWCIRKRRATTPSCIDTCDGLR